MQFQKRPKILRNTTFLMFCCSSFLVFAADFSADAILDSMTSVMQPSTSQGKMEQEIITSSRVKRVFVFEYFSADKGANVLIRYIEPRKVRHNAFLIKNSGDDIWVYFPDQKSAEIGQSC